MLNISNSGLASSIYSRYSSKSSVLCRNKSNTSHLKYQICMVGKLPLITLCYSPIWIVWLERCERRLPENDDCCPGGECFGRKSSNMYESHIPCRNSWGWSEGSYGCSVRILVTVFSASSELLLSQITVWLGRSGTLHVNVYCCCSGSNHLSNSVYRYQHPTEERDCTLHPYCVSSLRFSKRNKLIRVCL